MDATIRPGPVDGTVRAPPSKSYTHRALLAAGLGTGGRVTSPLRSADTEATAHAVESFGGGVTWTEGAADVQGVGGEPAVPADVIDCANSGTTMRLATALAGVVDGTTVLTGDSSLRERPQGPLLDALNQLGARAESTRGNGQAPLVVRGPMAGGHVRIPGDVSSQFVTGLLIAGALTDSGVAVELTSPLKSAPYVAVTLEVLERFGVSAEQTAAGYRVAGGQTYDVGGEYPVPGDFSSISYLLGAGALASTDGLAIEGAHPSAQGDVAIVELLERMGASIEWNREAGRLAVSAAPLSGVRVSVADTPDLLPTIAAVGAAAAGTTTITDCEHVRYKETDRVSVMASELRRMGAVVREETDSLEIDGDTTTLEGGTVDGHGDHRIVMALAVAGLAADGPTTIKGAEDVAVSFPGFFETLGDLGVHVETTD